MWVQMDAPRSSHYGYGAAVTQLLPTKMGKGWAAGNVTDVGDPNARLPIFTRLWGASGMGYRGIRVPLLLFWAARVQPLDKIDGNVFSGLCWGERGKKSHVLFRPGVNTVLRAIFVFNAATPPRTFSAMRHFSPPHSGIPSILTSNPDILQGWP